MADTVFEDYIQSIYGGGSDMEFFDKIDIHGGYQNQYDQIVGGWTFGEFVDDLAEDAHKLLWGETINDSVQQEKAPQPKQAEPKSELVNYNTMHPKVETEGELSTKMRSQKHEGFEKPFYLEGHKYDLQLPNDRVVHSYEQTHADTHTVHSKPDNLALDNLFELQSATQLSTSKPKEEAIIHTREINIPLYEAPIKNEPITHQQTIKIEPINIDLSIKDTETDDDKKIVDQDMLNDFFNSLG